MTRLPEKDQVSGKQFEGDGLLPIFGYDVGKFNDVDCFTVGYVEDGMVKIVLALHGDDAVKMKNAMKNLRNNPYTRTQPEAVDDDLTKELDYIEETIKGTEHEKGFEIFKNHLAAQGYLKTQPSEDVQEDLSQVFQFMKGIAPHYGDDHGEDFEMGFDAAIERIERELKDRGVLTNQLTTPSENVSNDKSTHADVSRVEAYEALNRLYGYADDVFHDEAVREDVDIIRQYIEGAK